MSSPIGTPLRPWTDDDKREWRSRQTVKRSYAEDVVAQVERLRARFDVSEYGRLDYDATYPYPLFSIGSRENNDALPIVLVTGGVHGYETSGVHGALQFVADHGADYAGRAKIVVAPCVSPWAYERIHRWNPYAVDPNRSFREGGSAEESLALLRYVAPFRERVLVHIDLHETTDSDETEFRPALAARDGKTYEPDVVPDGFYLVGDSEAPEPAFHDAIIAAVERVTHIAPADEKGNLIGTRATGRGVIHLPVRAIGLCTGVTGARYRTTTEVYPDSPLVTREQCNNAQVVAVRAAIEFALARL